MNLWIQKSIEIANSKGYLDKLHNIYTMNVNPERPLPSDIEPLVRKAFREKNDKKLIQLLIENAAVFPVKDSYIGFIRKKPEALDENPETTSRIAERLYSLGMDGLLREASRPKETNRQLGSSFLKFLPKLGYDMVEENEFVENDSDTLILKGGDRKLRRFAEDFCGCTLSKGIDIVFKKNGSYFIGEAKFLTTPGGEQDRGFDDASSFISEESGNATRIALLDGYIWLKSETGIYNKIIQSDYNIMTALLLQSFIESRP